MIRRHVGKMDRGARIVLGLALIAGYFVTSDTSWSWLYLLGGVVGLLTGMMGNCGLHSLFSVSTCRLK